MFVIGIVSIVAAASPMVVEADSWLVAGMLVVGGLSLAHWWNASVVLEGKELVRTNLLRATTLRGEVKWSSVDASSRHRRILCTMVDGRFVGLDGEWANAGGLFQALRDAGLASDTWPRREFDWIKQL